MSLNGKRENILYGDMLALGKENNIKSCRDIIDRVLQAAGHWVKYASEAGVPESKIIEIKKNLKLKINRAG
jgi:hypothetical protein